MKAAKLPGNSTVLLTDLPDPSPGYGQAIIEMRASTICGSDIRAIYREHLGSGPEAYQSVVAGHEPSGVVRQIGEGVSSVRPGDRVVVYHISGCGLCSECRKGYQISCISRDRAAYGWQRDGGHADLMLADEKDLLILPDNLTYLDGACVACGFGTAYEALCRLNLTGVTSLAVIGMGPVGMAVGMLAKQLGVADVVGVDIAANRLRLAEKLDCIDRTLNTSVTSVQVQENFDTIIECSGSEAGQELAVSSIDRWGSVVFVGEGGKPTFDISANIIHKQVTILGSWVSSTVRMQELLFNLAQWELHPERIVTDTFMLEDISHAYELAATSTAGKVAIVWPD